MSDEPQPQFFQAVKGSRADNLKTAPCALLLDPSKPIEVTTARLSWTPMLAARLREIASMAAETGRPEGKSLPFASLRAVLQVQVPDAVMLARDLGRPWTREETRAFMHVSQGSGGDCAIRAAGALRTWTAMSLRPWAHRLGLDEALIDAVDDAATPDQAFAVDIGLHDLARDLSTGQVFDRLRHPVLQEVSMRLEGMELFEGLGPVYRIVRGHSAGNEVQFQTWPTVAKSGGLYSMVASLSVESMPYLNKLVLVVRASRRRWLDEVPEATRLRRQRNLTGYLMGKGGPRIAVEFSTAVRSGVPEEPCSPEFMHQALTVRADLARPLAEMVQVRGRDVFLGLPYSPQRDGKAPLGAGAATRDQLDLLDAVAEPLAAIGMRPMAFRETADTKRAPKRAEEFHRALEAEALAADFAFSLGSNELNEEDLIEAARMLLEGGEPPEVPRQVAIEGRAVLEKIQDANRARLRRAFGQEQPTIVLVARREDERMLMRAAVNGLFGGGIQIAERQLPPNVHGARQDLPEADKKAKQRFAARIEAWRELADDLVSTYGGCHALVQADEWYGSKHDDQVNKLAGRHALATIGDANVQYLLPSVGNWRGLAGYLNRIQSAVYDLMFGHSGLISEVRSLLDAGFPEEDSRPRSIIGISLVTQARLSNGARGGQLCLATRIDAATGNATARVGWFENTMRWTGWLPFFGAMKHIAGLEAAVLGLTEEAKRRSFQTFVQDVIDAAVDADDRPLVLLDSTSATGMWPWLADARIDGPITIGPQSADKSARWASARLVRVRLGHAPRVLERKTTRYRRVGCDASGFPREEERYSPTVTAKTIEVSAAASGPGRHYWVTSGYFQASVPRGLSVYRKLQSFVPATKVRGLETPPGLPVKGLLTPIDIDISDEPYRVPTGLDVTVATACPDDRPDRVAHLVASLRQGYGHSRLPTTLPAPLFFEAKARDYMARFAIDDLDSEDGAPLPAVVTLDSLSPEPPPDSIVAETEDLSTDDEALDAIEAAAVSAAEAGGLSEAGRSTLPPTLTGRWSGLLRGSLAVSLIESTSLSGTRVEIPFGLWNGDPNGIAWPTGTRAHRTSAGEEPANQGEPRMTRDIFGPRWISANRNQVLPRPPFVSREWLLPKISLPGNPRLMKELHEWRQEIRDDTGFYWPNERPVTREQIADLMIEGMRHANFVRVLTRIVIRVRKDRDFHLFESFRKKVSPAFWPPRPYHRRAPRTGSMRPVADAIRLMAETVSREDAASMIYLYTLGHDHASKYTALARDLKLSELDAFLSAANDLADCMDWERDVVEQINAPRSPPTPRDEVGSGAGAQTEGLGMQPFLGEIGGDSVASTSSNALQPGEPVPDVHVPAGQSAPGMSQQNWEVGTDMGEMQGSQPFPETSRSDADQSYLSDPAAAALHHWQQAMTRLKTTAGRAESIEPNPDILRELISAARSSRGALRDWGAAQPRLADAAPLVARAVAILDRAALLPRAPSTTGVIAIAPGPVMVDPRILEEAGVLVDDAARELTGAEDFQARGKAIPNEQWIVRWEEISEWVRAADACMAKLCARLSAANALLADGAERAATSARTSRPRHPIETSKPLRVERSQAGAVAAPATAKEVEEAGTVTDGLLDAAVRPKLAPEGSAEPPRKGGMEPHEKETETETSDDPGFEQAEAEAHAEAETASDAQPAAGAELPDKPPTPLVQDQPDPLVLEITSRLEALFAARAFGAAYHLVRAAERVFRGQHFRFSADELRLAAMSGRIGHAAMQGSALLDRVVSGAVRSVQSAALDDTIGARCIVLTASCAELALFHPALPAAIGVDAINDLVPELREALHDLAQAIASGARYAFITPALLRTVRQEAADEHYLESCRKAIITNVDAFSKIQFHWVPANKIRVSLHQRSGVVGALREKIEAGDVVGVAAAREFANEYRHRGAIAAMLDRVDRTAAGKYRGLDGAARERMVSAIEDVAALCAEYADAADASPSARDQSQKALARRIAYTVEAGAEKAIRGLERFSQNASPLSAAAASFAISALSRLRDVVEGRIAPVGLHDHLIAVHGPLLWLPGLHYGSSWLPAPYDAEAVVNAILSQPMPPAYLAPSDDNYRTTVRARLEEGSFIAARMLIQGGSFYGIDEATRADMAEQCDANEETSRSEIKDSLDESRKLIDKVQRMGALVRLDDANAALAALDRIDPDSLPADVAFEARSEEEEPEQIKDFCSARDVISDMCDRVNSVLDAPRAKLLQELDALLDIARADDIEKVRHIIQDDGDLVTAGEYIGFLKEGGALPQTTFTNMRFHDFFPRIPDAFTKERPSIEAAHTAIESGADLGALPFSRIKEEHRAVAAEILNIWRNLRRRVHHGDQPTAVQTLVDNLFTAARLSPQVISAVVMPTNLPPKTYVCEFHFTIPQDSESLLLPDFGSRTGFNYRICIVPRMPTEGELSNLCRDAGTYGVMVLVTTAVEAERRRQLAVSSIEQRRTALVIDEAILLHALTEPEFRPLTMFECAQPFSFAAPYRDYGNAAVPREMFFGRKTEIHQIMDRMGSCVVYGGRRLGKTALLRHVASLLDEHGGSSSTAVGYANIRDIGSMPSRIWENASRELMAIFPEPVRTSAEFTAKVRAWLDGDSRRRALLLLDEADSFIEGDSKQQFAEFHRLQELMDGTARRFKFVLAGLHNVTRMVRTENSPLKQIASDPQRIGPLMDAELPDAERLVTRPLSALGYEFQSRSDVWRILSYCNYYPVLVQTFCDGLLAALGEETLGRKRPTWERGGIAGKHVREAIEDEPIRKEIGRKFDYTIREIDPRYELIACVVAERALHDAASGRVSEGMSTVDVLDAVCSWWPQAFDHANRFETVKDLLDEMVGLGVLRQTASGAWALRSHAILRLLGDESHVTASLLGFEKKAPKAAFDPRSMRRMVAQRPAQKEPPSYPCPLTMGQEYDLFASGVPVSLVFGSSLSDVGLVADALRSADPVSADGTKVAVTARSFSEKGSLIETVRSVGRGGPAAVVVDPRTNWEASWIEEAARQRAVADGRVRLVFVGTEKHALAWVCNPRAANVPLRVRVMPLQTWSDACLEHELGRDNLSPDRFVAELRRVTGGFNKLLASVLSGGAGNAESFARKLRTLESRLSKERTVLAELGVTPPMADLFRHIAEWGCLDSHGRIGTEDLSQLAADACGQTGLTAVQVIEFGTAIALLEPQAVPLGEASESRNYAVTPLLRIAAVAAQPVEAQ